ncbi:MAG: hypothetical protein SGBAC_009318 [Bacillariaceae sp.]
MWTRICFACTFLLSNALWVSNVNAFVPANGSAIKSHHHHHHHQQQQQQQQQQRTTGGIVSSFILPMTNDSNDNKDNNDNKDKDASTSELLSTQANYLDDLTPPPLNLKKESILFSPNPSTKLDNEVLDLWKNCKENLPAVITGAWPWRSTRVADEDPMGGLYNIAFVRLPVIGVGIGYILSLIQGHPLVMDFGQGPFEMSPLIVLSVLAFVLA